MDRGWKIVAALSLGTAVAGFRCPGDDPSALPPTQDSANSSTATSVSSGMGGIGASGPPAEGGTTSLGGGGNPPEATPCAQICEGESSCTLACESHERWCGNQPGPLFYDCFKVYNSESSIVCAHSQCPIDCPSLCKELDIRGCMSSVICEPNCLGDWALAGPMCGPVPKHALGRCVLDASATTCLADVNACLAARIFADATPCVNGNVCIDNWGVSGGPNVQCDAN